MTRDHMGSRELNFRYPIHDAKWAARSFVNMCEDYDNKVITKGVFLRAYGKLVKRFPQLAEMIEEKARAIIAKDEAKEKEIEHDTSNGTDGRSGARDSFDSES